MSARHHFLCRLLVPATPSHHRVPSSAVPRLPQYYGLLRLFIIHLGRLISSPGGSAGARPAPKSGFISPSKDC